MKKLSILTIVFFLIFLNISNFGWIFGITSKFDNTERRALAKFPSINSSNLSEFPKDFEKFFNDNFGFRNVLLNFYTWFELNIFQTPPFKTEILGKNNWIFYNSINKDNLKDWYSQVEFSERELKEIKKRLQSEKNWLASKNVPYLIVIVPDKEDIYPEYYPYDQKIGDIKLNQFLEYMNKNSDVNILYLKQPLIDAKKEYNYPLYYIYDTHWNNLGSFIGYQEIMRVVKGYDPSIDFFQKDDFNITAEKMSQTNVMDLLRGSAFWVERPEIRMHIELKKDSSKKFKELNSIIVYGDSYAHVKKWFDSELEGLAKYLQLSFVNYSTFFDGPAYALDYSEIEKKKPEIVIRQVIQRNISVLNAINCDEIIRCN